MAEHGQPDIAGAAATAQAEAAHTEVTASPNPGAIASVEAPPVHHGRPISWVAVTIIVIGFIAGGTALIFGPTWVVFWAGCGVAAFGGILALASGIFNDWY
jgi:hypothetical protein